MDDEKLIVRLKKNEKHFNSVVSSYERESNMKVQVGT